MKKDKVIVYYYMIGCPHCEANQKAWDETEKLAKKNDIKTVKIESQEPQCDESSFPTIVLKENGKKTKRVEGTQKSGGDVMKGLGLQFVGGRRRRTNRRRNVSRKRLFNRTLRNHVTLR
jgi:hypothetical protein